MDKEWHWYRTCELESKKKKYSETSKAIVPIMIGIGALFLAMLSVYYQSDKLHLETLLFGGIFTLLVIGILMAISNHVIKWKDCLMKK